MAGETGVLKLAFRNDEAVGAREVLHQRMDKEGLESLPDSISRHTRCLSLFDCVDSATRGAAANERSPITSCVQKDYRMLLSGESVFVAEPSVEVVATFGGSGADCC